MSCNIISELHGLHHLENSANLICSKTIVELDHANQFPSLPSFESGLTKYLVCAALGHVVADGVHGTPALEGGRIVRRKGLRHDLNCLVFKLMSMYESLRGDNTTGGSILVVHGRCVNQWVESARTQITDVGLHINFVNCLVTLLAFMTCS